MSDHHVDIIGQGPETRYKLSGAFHTGEPCQPIKDESGKMWGVTKPRRLVHIHSLGGEGEFFQAVSEQGRLLATRCANAGCPGRGTVYLPFRMHCPDCLARMETVDVTDWAVKGAKVYTFIKTERSGAFNTLPKPIRFVDVEIPGIATILKGYMVGPGDPAIGLRVVPVFRTKAPTYTIKDLAWVVEGTAAKDLPEGFAFAGKAR